MAARIPSNKFAEILGYSTNSIYTFLKEKRIKGVRVGTGRFRIPQSELDRFTSCPQSNGDSASSVILPVEHVGAEILPKKEGVIDVAGQSMENMLSVGRVRIGLPNILAWFVGISAIIAGLSMYLYNQSLSSADIGDMAPV